MLTQESVEFKKFVQPESKALKYLWLAMNTFVQLMATVLFVPVCRTLARAADCTRDAETGRWWLDAMTVSTPFTSFVCGLRLTRGCCRSWWVQGSNTTAAELELSGIECFTADHWPFLVPGVLLLVVFVALSARVMSVGGELANIEMRANPLDPRGDSTKRTLYAHTLSPHSTAHAAVTVAVKTVAVLASTFMGTRHPIVGSGERNTAPLLRSPAVLVLTALSPRIRRCWSRAGW